MFKPSKKWVALLVSAGLLTSMAGVSAAQKYDESNVGISAAVDRYIESNQDEEISTEGTTQATPQDAQTATASDAGLAEATVSEETSEEASTVKYPQFEGRAIATVSGNLNIREEANAESEKVGTLARGGICLRKEKGDEWSLIASGNCVGYVMNQYLAFGDDAGEWAEANLSKRAVVNTTTLKVRESADENSTCLTLIPGGESYTVLGTENGWTKLEIDEDCTGYVKSDYVDIEFDTVKAVTVEEEAAKEEAARKAAEAEAQEQAAANSSSSSNSNSSSSSNSSKKTTQSTTEATTQAQTSAPSGGSGSATKSDLVSYALQFVGNPYVYGGNSLTNGTDCSGFTMLIYQQYGYSLPHSARAQSNCGTEISVSDVQPGDLLFYSKNGSINHVALYIGNGQVVHASSPSSGIKISVYNYRTPCKAVRIMN